MCWEFFNYVEGVSLFHQAVQQINIQEIATLKILSATFFCLFEYLREVLDSNHEYYSFISSVSSI